MINRTLLSAAGFSCVWVIAALAAPDTTFHLAPAIVAAVPALRDPGSRTGLAIGGSFLAVAVAVVLAGTGHLEGPSLLPVGDAFIESLVGALLGGAVAWVYSGRVAATVSDHRQSVTRS
jgi:hypothetical protein